MDPGQSLRWVRQPPYHWNKARNCRNPSSSQLKPEKPQDSGRCTRPRVVGAPAPIEAGAAGTHHGTQLADRRRSQAGRCRRRLKVLSDREDEESFPSRPKEPSQSASGPGLPADGRAPRGWTHRAAPAVPARPAAAPRPPPSRSRPPCTQAGRSTCSSLGPCWCRWRRPAGLVVRAVVEVCEGGGGGEERCGRRPHSAASSPGGRLRGRMLTLVAEEAPSPPGSCIARACWQGAVRQPGYRMHWSQYRPCQPTLHLRREEGQRALLAHTALPAHCDVTANKHQCCWSSLKVWAALGISKPQGQLRPASEGLTLGRGVNQAASLVIPTY